MKDNGKFRYCVIIYKNYNRIRRKHFPRNSYVDDPEMNVEDVISSAIKECDLEAKSYIIRGDKGCDIFEAITVVLKIISAADIMSKVPSIMRNIKRKMRNRYSQEDTNIEWKTADLNSILHGNDCASQEELYTFVFNNKGSVTIDGCVT